MPRVFLCALLLLAAIQAAGCAASNPYGIYEDKRLADTMADDKAIAAAVKTRLLQTDFSETWNIGVYCYYAEVFLVGEAPENLREKAVGVATGVKGVRRVKTHWFRPAKGDHSDLLLAAALRSNLVGAKGLSSTRIDTEVNADRVVLLGVAGSERERDLAVQAAWRTKGVKEVASYLMLPL